MEPSSPRRHRAFTLIEVLIALAILAILMGIALPRYSKYKETAKVNQAITDISATSVLINLQFSDAGVLPDFLEDVPNAPKVDPWGYPYEYYNYASGKGKGKPRKDKHLKPLNSDFDLYSVGKDGASSSPLNAKASRDDVVRARDGRFVGLAEDFDP